MARLFLRHAPKDLKQREGCKPKKELGAVSAAGGAVSAAEVVDVVGGAR